MGAIPESPRAAARGGFSPLRGGEGRKKEEPTGRSPWAFVVLPHRSRRLRAGAGLGPLLARLDEAAEELDVQPGGALRGGVPLDAQREPAVALKLEGLDDAVEGAGGDDEAAGDAVDGPAVLAVDDDLALAVEAGQARA